jgi:hypothetical protein
MFHSIQFTYDYQESLWWMEATAVWMEEKVYDSVNDYLNYLPYFMSQPEISLDNEDGFHPYADCIWPIYLDDNFGVDIMREIWERCDDIAGGNSINDNNYVLQNNYGSSFFDEFVTFTSWNYICGSNDDGHHYSEGSLFPDVAIEKVHWAYPVENASVTNKPEQYGCNYIRCSMSGDPVTVTVDFNGDTMYECAVLVVSVTTGGVYTVHEMTLNPWQNGSLIIDGSEGLSRIVLVVSNIGSTDYAEYEYSVYVDPVGVELADHGVKTPEHTALRQNSPNPFNPSTEISFFVSDEDRGAPMTLDVFNTMGQRVRTLLNRPAAGGHQLVRWDGTDDGGTEVASGVYYYKLAVGEREETRQMLLLK